MNARTIRLIKSAAEREDWRALRALVIAEVLFEANIHLGGTCEYISEWPGLNGSYGRCDLFPDHPGGHHYVTEDDHEVD